MEMTGGFDGAEGATESSDEVLYDAYFTEDDHYFHSEYLTDEQADMDAAEILGLLSVPRGARLLDAGCGDGRLATRLAALGYDLVGIDHDEDQLDRARTRSQGLAIDWRREDLHQLRDESVFDGAFLWFNTFGFGSVASNHLLVRRLSDALRPGGTLLIDTLWREGIRGVLEQEDSPVEVIIDGARQIDASSFDQETGYLTTLRSVIPVNGERYTRVLRQWLPTLVEWGQLLEAAGLTMISTQGRAGEQLTEDTLELVVVAKRDA